MTMSRPEVVLVCRRYEECLELCQVPPAAGVGISEFAKEIPGVPLPAFDLKWERLKRCKGML